MKKFKAVISAIVAVLMFCSFAVVAHDKTTKKKTTTTKPQTVSSESKSDKEEKEEKGIRLEDATPEEIADIGVGAQIAAGQKPDNVTVVTVTDLLPEEDPAKQAAVADTSTLNTVVAVLIALVSVLFIAVGVLYYFAYRAGLFNPDRR